MDDSQGRALIAAVEGLVGPALERSAEWRALATAVGAWLIDQSAAATRRAESDRVMPALAASAGAEPGDASTLDGRAVMQQVAPAAPASLPASDIMPAAPPSTFGSGATGRPWTIADFVSHQPESQGASSAGVGDSSQTAKSAGDGEGSSFLSLIVERCRLKAEACRVYIDRRAAVQDPVREGALVARIQALIERARALPDCFLWMLFRQRTQPDDDTLRLIAGCYDALADAAVLIAALERLDRQCGRDDWQQAFELFAQAASALRVALRATWLTTPDTDQYTAFDWLHEALAMRGIQVARYLRRGDDADPARAPEVGASARAAAEAAERRLAAPARLRAAFRQLRYHAQQAEREPSPFDEPHVRRLAELLDAMAADGVDQADPRFRDVISGALAARLAAVAPPGVQPLLRRLQAGSVEEEAAADVGAAPEGTAAEAVPGPRVLAVRRLLAGRQVVLVGGQPREDAARRLERAFNLASLRWVPLTEHGSGEPLRAPIFHADTVLVLGLVKLAGHLHLEQARNFARAAGRPFVTLPAGYNPEQVASAVLEQASGRLQPA